LVRCIANRVFPDRHPRVIDKPDFLAQPDVSRREIPHPDKAVSGDLVGKSMQ
jgi:hypothetical protein